MGVNFTKNFNSSPTPHCAKYLVMLFVLLTCFAAHGVAENPQVTAARGVITRTLSTTSVDVDSAFVLKLNNASSTADIFTLATAVGPNGTIVSIEGTSGVAITSGFYHYLRFYCNGSVSWGLDRTGIQLGAAARQPLPLLPDNNGIRIVATSQYRYMYNFCTLSYSLAFASAEDWAVQVDWLALHGINLPLAAMGTEHVEALTYLSFGLTENELEDYFPGPAFLGWHRMSDMDGPWSGPLTPDWRRRRALVANATMRSMRSLGMKPVLMAFGGHVPCQLKRVFPNASLAPRQHWQGFNSSCLLQPSDPLFEIVARRFMETQRTVFGNWAQEDGAGAKQFYATDQWNEISPSSYEPSYLASMSAAVYQAMVAVDENAIWVMQAWFLVSIALCRQGQTAHCNNGWLANATATPPYPRAAAYLSGVPHGRLLILDLEANAYPVYMYTDAFYGHDFIWSMIHNFGQKPGMYGNLSSMALGPPTASAAAPANFRGIGLAMEGINQNAVVYELAAEMAWHGDAWPLNQTAWVQQYQVSRYGSGAGSASTAEAWRLLTEPKFSGVYTSAMGNGGTVSGYVDGSVDLRLTVDPKAPLPAVSPPGHNATNMALVCDRLLNAFADAPTTTLRYDMVDSCRQMLDNLLWDVSRVVEAAFHRCDAVAVESAAHTWVQLAVDLDSLLSTDANFMLGPWITAARATANTSDNIASGGVEADLLEYNARNQITLWGPHHSGLSDYARKMWSGLLRTYHLAGRWGETLAAATAAVLDPTSPYDPAAVAAAITKHETAWQTNFTEVFPVEPTALALHVASVARRKYAAEMPSGFTPIRDSSTGVDWHLLEQPTWTKRAGSIGFLCSIDSGCVGFDTGGMLIRRVSKSGKIFDPSKYLKPTPGMITFLREGL